MLLSTIKNINQTNNQIITPVLNLNKKQLFDLECLINGSFYPLTGFLSESDYNSVCNNMRLTNGMLWPMPINLDVSEEFANLVTINNSIILADDENTPLALLTITSKWRPNKQQEAQLVFGTMDQKHPGVDYLFNKTNNYYLGGDVNSIKPIIHYDFIEYRHTPEQLKQLFKLYNWSKIVAFQTRNPMHRAHYELTLRASKAADAKILIHPVVGMTKPGDIEYITRVKCYESILNYYPNNQKPILSLLPLAMRMAGPREAIWHAIIRKNYGVTHFIIGRDHAGPGLNTQGMPFYDPYAAQKILLSYADEIGIEIMNFPAIVYVKNKDKFLATNELESQDIISDISGTELRNKLELRLNIPDWFSFPEIIKILQSAYKPKLTQGLTLFFTGLSGSGKSTIAKAVLAKLATTTNRNVTLLDGDVIRKNLSSGLGFSRQDRDTNILRIGFVAAEITKHQGIAICSAIAPFAEARNLIKNNISQYGGFIEIYVSTPIETCKKRDIKGLYKKAEDGLIKGFTGVDDPYEIPINPDIVIDTSILNIDNTVTIIFDKLIQLGYIA